MEACDAQGNPNPNLVQYLPTGVDQLGLVEHEQRNLAYLCEGAGAVAFCMTAIIEFLSMRPPLSMGPSY